MTGTSPTRILVVDDHQMFAQAIAGALREYPEFTIVGIAEDLATSRTLLATTEVDLVLLDHRLPDGMGSHAVSELRALRPGVKIILVTAAAEASVLNEALAAGCAGFVTKEDGVDALVAAINAVKAGATPVSPGMLAQLSTAQGRTVVATEALTPREMAVILLLADGLSNQVISQRLLISIHTLRNHIQSVIDKLGAHSKLEAVTIAIRQGLIEAPTHAAS